MGDGGGESNTRDAEILAETKKETQPSALLIETQGPQSNTHGSPVMALLWQLSKMTVYCLVV